MPCTVPRLTTRWISLFAWTGPKCLLMPISSMAIGDAAAPEGRRACTGSDVFAIKRWRNGSDVALAVGAGVEDFQRARIDVGTGFVHGCLHFRRDQLGIVLVHSGGDAALL